MIQCVKLIFFMIYLFSQYSFLSTGFTYFHTLDFDTIFKIFPLRFIYFHTVFLHNSFICACDFCTWFIYFYLIFYTWYLFSCVTFVQFGLHIRLWHLMYQLSQVFFFSLWLWLLLLLLLLQHLIHLFSHSFLHDFFLFMCEFYLWFIFNIFLQFIDFIFIYAILFIWCHIYLDVYVEMQCFTYYMITWKMTKNPQALLVNSASHYLQYQL